MNIFKILANGDGSINEPNVSAFLGYLLNPYEDHGLGHLFLHRFLNKYFEKDNQDKGVYFQTDKYDYEILFEQAFIDENKEIKNKEIVDIVILCFENNKGKTKEQITQNILKKENKIEHKIEQEIKHIFLIENKIKDSSKKDMQLTNQFKNCITTLPKEKVISFYITPDEDKFKEEFNNFKENDKKHHYLWKNKNDEDKDDKDDIYNLLLDIVKDESMGKIEAINEYTRHTLISFIRFIENDFKSQLAEKKEGLFQKDIFDNIDDYLSKYEDNLNDESNKLFKEFTYYIKGEHKNLSYRHSKTHPISVFIKDGNTDKKIISLTQNGKNLCLHLIYRNLEISEEQKNIFKESIKVEFETLREDTKYLKIKSKEGNYTIDKIKGVFENYLEIIVVR